MKLFWLSFVSGLWVLQTWAWNEAFFLAFIRFWTSLTTNSGYSLPFFSWYFCRGHFFELGNGYSSFWSALLFTSIFSSESYDHLAYLSIHGSVVSCLLTYFAADCGCHWNVSSIVLWQCCGCQACFGVLQPTSTLIEYSSIRIFVWKRDVRNDRPCITENSVLLYRLHVKRLSQRWAQHSRQKWPSEFLPSRWRFKWFNRMFHTHF